MTNDSNERFLIRRFEVESTRVSFYLLNPGETFAGFGGSSAGLTVRKTASLIIRREHPAGVEDTESDLRSKGAWDWYNRMAREQAESEPLSVLRQIVEKAKPLVVEMGEQFADPFPVKFEPEIEVAREFLKRMH